MVNVILMLYLYTRKNFDARSYTIYNPIPSTFLICFYLYAYTKNVFTYGSDHVSILIVH